MSRDYAKISPRFWIGDTGRKLRSMGLEAQVIAAYLISCPSANHIGLYYLPIPTISHETGIPFKGASKALRRLSEGAFAYYDEAQEVVWVPEMARHQIDEELKTGDKRILGIAKEAEKYRKCRYYQAFVDKYKGPFRLPPMARPLSPFEGPSEALRSQEQEQDQDQEQEQESPLPLFQVEAARLWALQEDLRKQSIPGCRPLKATDERLDRVAERLAGGATPEDCEHVLRVYAEEAQRKPESRDWFNGETNWRKANFERALGKTPGHGSTAAKPTPTPGYLRYFEDA